MNKELCEFEELFLDYQIWFISADKSEDGWQSDYPRWNALMENAMFLMGQPENINKETLHKLEYCWSISEETEDLADYAKENVKQCWNILEFLVTSHYPSVRWQIYSVLGENSAYASIELLKEGIKDTDSYCRRRALLSLAKLKPKDMQQIIRPLLNDQDAYIHQIVSRLLNVG